MHSYSIGWLYDCCVCMGEIRHADIVYISLLHVFKLICLMSSSAKTNHALHIKWKILLIVWLELRWEKWWLTRLEFEPLPPEFVVRGSTNWTIWCWHSSRSDRHITPILNDLRLLKNTHALVPLAGVNMSVSRIGLSTKCNEMRKIRT